MDKSEDCDTGLLEKIFSKIRQYDAKKLGYRAFVGGLFIILITSFSILNLQLSTNAILRKLMVGTWILPVCNVFEPRSDFCEIEGDIRVEGKSSSIYFTSSTSESWRIKPYARKGDDGAMKRVTELSVKSFLENDEQAAAAAAPDCSMKHNTPAIVFSIGGYAGNQFHDFTEILLPLFLTSHHFHQEVQFLVTNSKPGWLSKYAPIIKQLSKYPIIDIDRVGDVIHCYQSVIVGLKHHKDLGVDPMKDPQGYYLTDFAEFLKMAYSLKRSSATKIDEKDGRMKPRLLILSRVKTRRFTNEEEIVAMAKDLGYEVVVAEPGVTATASNFTHIVNSCDVMVAVHGAGCTNLLFLPCNAILIQIFPLGPLEKFGRRIYGEPAQAMNLRYLEYKIRVGESSLVERYPFDDDVFRDPGSFSRQGWGAVKSVYLDQQDVKLDIARFRVTLLEALELLHHH